VVKATRAISPRLRGVTVLEALNEPELLGSSLIGDAESWAAWKAFLSAFFGLPLSDSQLPFIASARAAKHRLRRHSRLPI